MPVLEAVGAEKIDVFLYQPESDSLVAMGTSDTPLARRQRHLGLDRLPLVNGGRVVDAYQTGAALSNELDKFTDEDLAFLLAVAGWIGMVADRAELAEAMAERAFQRGRRTAAEEVALLTPRQRDGGDVHCCKD